MAEKAILFDASKCTACRGCQIACKQWNENDEAIPTVENGVNSHNTGSYENPPDLSPTTWVKMRFIEVEPAPGKVRWLFARQACMHCTDAACVKVCPNGTLYHDAQYGVVMYNQDTCTGCGYCVDACPFNVPRLDNQGVLDFSGKMSKCSFCLSPGYNRLDEGWEPACVKTCPPGALSYGDRNDMLAAGQQRVAELQGQGWSNANLYGATELGGLHVMYVLDDSPQVYGLPVNPQISPATVAWKDVLQPVGWVLGGLTIVGLGVNWLAARANVNKEAKTK